MPDTEARSFLFTTDKELAKEASEDYAIAKVPYHWKRDPRDFAITLFGAATSVFTFALGGQLALNYGMPTLLVALAIGFLIAVPLTGVIAWQCANSSIATDLLARGAGFGFLGSTITALLYGMNWLMYAGFETAFLSSAIHAQWSAPPLWLLYAATSLAMVPLNWYGVSQIHWVQKWSVPLFAAGLIWVFVTALGEPTVSVSGHIGLDTVLPALAAVLANVGIWVLLVGDYSRFARKSDRRRVVAIATFVALGSQFLILPIIGGVMALHTGSENPGTYAVQLVGVGGLAWIVITQMRVQEANYYSASLSLKNFTARALHILPGRRVFLLLTAMVAFLLAQFEIVAHLTNVLTFMGVFLFAWIGTMIFSLYSERRALAQGEVWIEHRRGYLRNWGWPAVVGLVVGSTIGAIFALSEEPAPYGGFIGVVAAFVVAPAVMAIGLTRYDRKSYLLARTPPPEWRDTNVVTDAALAAPTLQVVCGVCENSAMKPDALQCPVVEGGTVCSSCCSAHSTCGEVCKEVGGGLASRENAPSGIATT
jgi:purine-cytosine permease-like protein